jgi:hypothetical protein
VNFAHGVASLSCEGSIRSTIALRVGKIVESCSVGVINVGLSMDRCRVNASANRSDIEEA